MLFWVKQFSFRLMASLNFFSQTFQKKDADATSLPQSFFKLLQFSCHSPPTEIPKGINNLLISKSSTITQSLLSLNLSNSEIQNASITSSDILHYMSSKSNIKRMSITPNLNLFSFLHSRTIYPISCRTFVFIYSNSTYDLSPYSK